jgi:hypothetical protein
VPELLLTGGWENDVPLGRGSMACQHRHVLCPVLDNLREQGSTVGLVGLALIDGVRAIAAGWGVRLEMRAWNQNTKGGNWSFLLVVL